MGYIKLIIVELLIYYLLFLGYQAFAEQPEGNPGELNALAEFMVLDNQDYMVSAAAAPHGQYLDFLVRLKGEEGEYPVSGILNLYKMTREIGIIAEYRRQDEGSQVYAGGKNSVVAIGKGWKQLVVHPGDSAVATGQALGRVGRFMGRGVKGIFVRPQRSSTGEDLGDAGDGMTGEQAREIAYELHLDVYSKNPYLRGFLEKPARKRWLGRQLTIMPAYAIVTGGALFLRLSSTVGSQGVATYEQQIRRLPSAELIIWLEKVMAEKFGLDADDDRFEPCLKFLSNPNYTPRQKTYAVYYLGEFSAAPRLLRVVKRMAGAATVSEADYFFYQLLFLWSYHTGREEVAELHTNDYGICATAKDGKVLLFIPCDYADAAKLADRGLLRQLQRKGGSVWCAGSFSPELSATLLREGGIELHPYLLRDKGYAAVLCSYIMHQIVTSDG